MESGHPCLTDRVIKISSVNFSFIIILDLILEYRILIHLIKFSGKSYFSSTLIIKLCSTLSKAFSWSKEIKAAS